MLIILLLEFLDKILFDMLFEESWFFNIILLFELLFNKFLFESFWYSFGEFKLVFWILFLLINENVFILGFKNEFPFF